jgi:anti-sigma factor RsiW
MSEIGVPEIEELIGAYALDAVEPHERELVEQHLAVCARCRAELADHREVAALLAYDGKPAPTDVWNRILSSLEEPPPALRLTLDTTSEAPSRDVVAIDEGRRARSRRRAFAVMAGVAAALALVLGVVVLGDGSQAPVERELASVADDALADPTSSRTTLRPPGESTGPEATAVVTADGRGFILAGDLPALDADRTYQLWGISNDQAISLGVLGPDPGVAAFQVDDKAAFGAYAITEETAGGVISSQNDPLLVGETA